MNMTLKTRRVGAIAAQVALLLSLSSMSLFAGTVSGAIQLTDATHDKGEKKKKNYSGAVIWLQPLSPIDLVRITSSRARIVQKSKEFQPHVLAVHTGTVVDFPNLDPMFHNAYSSFDGKIFDLGLYPPGQSRSIRFDREGLVRVFCNIHPAMSAVVVVVKTPYYAVTNSQGEWEIPDVPPGDYRMHVYFERATPETLGGLQRRLTVTEEAAVMPVVKISERGYVFTPHKNKYGREYMPTDSYGGVK